MYCRFTDYPYRYSYERSVLRHPPLLTSRLEFRPLTQLPSILVFWYFLIKILKYRVASTLTRLQFYEYFIISKYSLASRGGYFHQNTPAAPPEGVF
jgi:hypothetical protein